MFLSVCHTVVIDEKHGYSASSPDELALVNFAKYAGYEFIKRDGEDNIHVKLPTGEIIEYKLLNVCEFTSTRKRMSCIFECPNRDHRKSEKEIVIMTKGADSIMEE